MSSCHTSLGDMEVQIYKTSMLGSQWGGEGFSTRVAEVYCAQRIRDIHLLSFRGFFLSSLGSRFLEEFYRGIVSDDKSVVVVAVNNGSIVGFAAGTFEPKGFYRRLGIWRVVRLVLSALPVVFSRPSVALKIARRVIRSRVGTATVLGRALLMSLAVDPRATRKGIGRKLVGAFLDQARGRKCKGVWLTTDAIENGGANALYEKCGLRLSRVFLTVEGRAMNEYTIDFE